MAKKSNTARTPKARAKRMRPQMRKGYVCECAVCGNGLVRFFVYRGAVVGLCDECELVWTDLERLKARPKSRPAGSFPTGPDREGGREDWRPATRREVEKCGMDGLVAGYSD